MCEDPTHRADVQRRTAAARRSLSAAAALPPPCPTCQGTDWLPVTTEDLSHRRVGRVVRRIGYRCGGCRNIVKV